MRALAIVVILLFSTPALAQFYPTEWDWRDVSGVNCVSGVRNNQSCGIGWIFAPTAVVEARHMIALERAGLPVTEFDYSEQYILSCGSGYFGSFDCGSGYAKDVFTFFVNTGAPPEACFEYIASDASCPSTCPDSGDPIVLQQIPGPVTEWINPSGGDMAREVFYNGPIVATMDVYTDFYSYSSGIYRHVTGQPAGGHTVTIVGYGQDGSTTYWICKNSWSTSWGEDGFFRIARDGTDNCNFGEWVWFAEVGMPATAVPAAPAARYVLRNHPNPFNPATTFTFGTVQAGEVTLRIYDAAGHLVRTLLREFRDPSPLHEVLWDGRDDAGRMAPSGTYYSRLVSPGFSTTGKLALIR